MKNLCWTSVHAMISGKLQANTGQLVMNEISKFTDKTLHNAKPWTPSIHIQEVYLVSWKGMQCLMPLRMWEKNASASQPVVSASWVRWTAEKERTKCEFTQLGAGKERSPQPCSRYNHIPNKSKFWFSVGNLLQKTVQSTVFWLQSMSVTPDI